MSLQVKITKNRELADSTEDLMYAVAMIHCQLSIEGRAQAEDTPDQGKMARHKERADRKTFKNNKALLNVVSIEVEIRQSAELGISLEETHKTGQDSEKLCKD